MARTAAVAALALLWVNGMPAGRDRAVHGAALVSTVATPTDAGSTATSVSESDGLDVHAAIPFFPEQPLDAGTAAQLAAQLARARTVALQYPTVADAEAAGYVEATGFASGVGAHYLKFSEISGVFDVDHPSMILYDGDLPRSRVAGLAYYVISGVKPPEGFAGPNDHWHQHLGVCVTPNGPVLAADAATTCRLGGRPAWMLHVWVAPAYPSVQGVFSPDNVSLEGSIAAPGTVYHCHLTT